MYAARSGKLQLDRAIITREVGFYALSIAFLYIALHNRQPADDDEVGDEHIFISFGGASLLFGGYICYVAVCAYMDNIVAFFSRETPAHSAVTKSGEERQKLYGSIGENVGRLSLLALHLLHQ